jgi:hypothetical protein
MVSEPPIGKHVACLRTHNPLMKGKHQLRQCLGAENRPSAVAWFPPGTLRRFLSSGYPFLPSSLPPGDAQIVVEAALDDGVGHDLEREREGERGKREGGGGGGWGGGGE